MADLSAVLVSWNVRDLTLRCIQSLKDDGITDIVVVDNDSSDGSADAIAQHHPDVRLVRLTENIGFGPGVNRAVARTSTSFVLVTTPDVYVDEGSTQALQAILDEHPDAGFVAPRIDTPDGKLYPSVRRLPGLVDAAAHTRSPVRRALSFCVTPRSQSSIL